MEATLTGPGRQCKVVGFGGRGLTSELAGPLAIRRFDESRHPCNCHWIFALKYDVLALTPTSPMKIPRLILLFCLALCTFAAPGRLRAEEDWQDAGRTLFDIYADAMQGKNYSVFINNCESKSRSLFREFTLWQMDLMTDEDLMGVLPRDENNRPISLKQLVELDDKQFWVLYTDWMRKRELAMADKLREKQGLSGLPVYSLKVLTKYGDTLYMVAERTYAKPSPVPIPLTVLEAVKENGQWKLKIPREIIWDAMEAGRARSLQIEEELKTQPYDVRPPLKPPVDSPLPPASNAK